MNYTERITKNLRGRLNPEAFIAVTSSFSLVHQIPFYQIGLGFAIKEFTTGIPQEILALSAVGLLGIAYASNIYTDAKALAKKSYSANIFSTGLHIAGNPIPKSTSIGYALSLPNWADVPITLETIASIISGHGIGDLFFTNFIAKSALYFTYYNTMNILLMQNRMGFITDKINPAFEKVETKIKNIFRRKNSAI